MNTVNNITAENHPTRAAEQKLIRQMLRGEEDAFREFVGLYQDRLFNAVLPQVDSRDDAEEIVQETFVKAIEHLPQFQHQSQLYTWIYRIAWNTRANRYRRRRNPLPLETSVAESQSQAPAWTEPHVPMERRERVEMLWRGLGAIEKRHCRILLLREFDELSYQQIADAMGIPLGTVRSRLARARTRLREELQKLDHGLGELEARQIGSSPAG